MDIPVLEPKGLIGLHERDLMAIAIGLMLLVVIPVLIMAAVITWKYRAHRKATYTPEWSHSHLIEGIWWGFPMVIIAILAVVTWRSSIALDPFKPLESSTKPLTIQAVALQWKWLFLYPEHGIATINYVRFPEHTPLNFQITADAPMNSFWIPALGGQIYAMPGMKCKLHLIANEVGRFAGSSANLSGAGFSGMRFVAEATSQGDFDDWVHSVQQAPHHLTKSSYLQLVKPSSYCPESLYALPDSELYDWIVMRYMMPMEETCLPR